MKAVNQKQYQEPVKPFDHLGALGCLENNIIPIAALSSLGLFARNRIFVDEFKFMGDKNVPPKVYTTKHEEAMRTKFK